MGYLGDGGDGGDDDDDDDDYGGFVVVSAMPAAFLLSRARAAPLALPLLPPF